MPKASISQMSNSALCTVNAPIAQITRIAGAIIENGMLRMAFCAASATAGSPLSTL
jgi:hypothetical protein